MKSDLNSVYNITNNNERTNIEIVETICQALDEDFANNVEFIKDRPGHDFRYSISPERYKQLEIEHNSNIAEAIKETIDYFKESING